MDAKPQRLRVRADENAPIAHPGKTIHQRNKSTPALSSAFQNVTAKNGPKRSAFGDLSNKANLVRLAHDDSSLAGKNQKRGLEKPLPQDKKPGILSQPAQRHVPGAGLKSAMNNVTNSRPAEPSGKATGASQPLANTRRVLNKRANAVFKDPLQQSVETKGTASKETRTGKADGAPASRPSVKLVHKVEPEQDPPQKGTLKDSSVKIKEADECSVVKADVTSASESDESKPDEHDSKVQEIKEDAAREIYVTASEVPEVGHLSQKDTHESVSIPHAGHNQMRAPSDPEEYWDDEEDENEEDDGYTTARSYRSRGDNTTGGATTVLFPQYNQQVKRELTLAKQIVDATRTAEDIEDEYWDTSMVAEYSDDIFHYMKEQEIKMLPDAHYMDNQAEIQWSMRSVLMDWLVQVHHRFSLLPETLFLCVNYIDRFLSCKIVSLGKLQLVGATAIFIAAKYEEINCPSVQEIVYMVDGGYTMDEILKAERFMLSMLQFELGWPGPMSFLRRISKADDYDLETRTLAKYFLEITIMDERFVGSPPSFLSAGAHCLARMMLRKGSWTPAHVHYSEYTYLQLLPLISLMLECCENPRKHHAAIYEKYSDKRFKRASLFVEAEVKKGFHIPDVPKENPAVDSEYSWKRTFL